MSDVIDLGERRNASVQPDAKFQKRDEHGRLLFAFGYEFDHSDGKPYGFEIWAYDFADAEEKMASIRKSGRIVGQIFCEVPA